MLLTFGAACASSENGGPSGSGGATGTAGTPGTAGAIGSAGTTGTAGTTGSGGTTGSAGTTGTGGMAGYPAITNCRTFGHAATSGCPSVYVNSVAISPNGQLVATGGSDYRVKIWNFDGRNLSPTGMVFTEFNGYTVVFSPDGTRLAYTSGLLNSGVISVRTYMVSGWAAGTIYQGDGSTNILRGVGFTPDSQRLVSVNAIGSAGGDVFVHNVGGSALPAYTAHVAHEPYALAVSPRAASDGSVGVAVGSYYGTATVLSLGTTGFAAMSKDVPASTAARTTYTLEFAPDGSQLVTGEDSGAVRFFAYPLGATPAPIAPAITFAGGDSVNDVAFSPNGMYLAVGGAFSTKQLSIYSVATHMELDRATPAGDVNSLAFSPSGAAIVAGLDACGSVIVCSP
jgi:WD40 repeat protein